MNMNLWSVICLKISFCLHTLVREPVCPEALTLETPYKDAYRRISVILTNISSVRPDRTEPDRTDKPSLLNRTNQ